MVVILFILMQLVWRKLSDSVRNTNLAHFRSYSITILAASRDRTIN